MKKLTFEKASNIMNVLYDTMDKKNNGITLSTYNGIIESLKDLMKTGKTKTIQNDVITFLKRFDNTLKITVDGIGWMITL